MRTYIFDGTFEGLLCTAVSIYKSGEHADRIFPYGENYQSVLFDEVTDVITEQGLAERAKRRIRGDWNTFVLAWLYDSADDHIVHLANCLSDYYRDRSIMEQRDREHVETVIRYSRKTANERHRMLEFVRFEELEDGVYLSEIAPDADVLFMLGRHFRDRMSGSDEWMIYDSRRGKLLSCAGGELLLESADLVGEKRYSEKEASYQKLWKVFFENIAIKERTNLKLQDHHVPRRYREHMTEFK